MSPWRVGDKALCEAHPAGDVMTVTFYSEEEVAWICTKGPMNFVLGDAVIYNTDRPLQRCVVLYYSRGDK